jgi:hypothetical protein
MIEADLLMNLPPKEQVSLAETILFRASASFY